MGIEKICQAHKPVAKQFIDSSKKRLKKKRSQNYVNHHKNLI